ARAMADLHLPYGASVLTLPSPSGTFTAPLRWQADTGMPTSMVGGYFMGPVAGGQVFVGGPGMPPAVKYPHRMGLDSRPGPVQTPGLDSSGKVMPPRQVKDWVMSSGLSAVVAVTRPDSPLARYLDHLLGPPATQSGTVICWRVHRA